MKAISTPAIPRSIADADGNDCDKKDRLPMPVLFLFPTKKFLIFFVNVVFSTCFSPAMLYNIERSKANTAWNAMRFFVMNTEFHKAEELL